MATNTSIEWTDTTWNPIAGCKPVSPGCLNCYAATMSHRLAAMGQQKYIGLTTKRDGRQVFTGTVAYDHDAIVAPFSWRKPRTVFVNSMSDLFIEQVPFDFIDEIFAVMALCQRHTFQVLTKRPERMAEYLNMRWAPSTPTKVFGEMVESDGGSGRANRIAEIQETFVHRFNLCDPDNNDHWTSNGSCKATSWSWPLPNVWLGTSVEDQKRADERIPHLLRCPAAVRFLSCEPLLGMLELETPGPYKQHVGRQFLSDLRSPFGKRDVIQRGIQWVIVGGESGPKARPMHIAWARSIRDQCQAAGVPFFFKQWGAWHPEHGRVGKKRDAGRVLDGREWNEMPAIAVEAQR